MQAGRKDTLMSIKLCSLFGFCVVELVQGFMVFHKYLEAQQIINGYLLFDLKKIKRKKRLVSTPTPVSCRDSVSPSSFRVFSRHLKGRYCLALIEFGMIYSLIAGVAYACVVVEGGEQQGEDFTNLYEDCHNLLIGIHATSDESKFLSQLAVTLRDQICNIATLQGRLDDAVAFLRNAIESANVSPVQEQLPHHYSKHIICSCRIC